MSLQSDQDARRRLVAQINQILALGQGAQKRHRAALCALGHQLAEVQMRLRQQRRAA